MNPWWLRPPAEEEPAKKKAAKPAPKPKQESSPESPKKESAAGPRKSTRSRGGKRRRSPAAKGKRSPKGAPRLAIFLDAESLASSDDADAAARVDFETLLTGLATRGQIIAKRAYGDWGRHPGLQERLQEGGFEVVELPAGQSSGDRRAAIKLAVDAVELSVSAEPCGTFVLISGSGDFSPLVAKLQEAKRKVVGIGDRQSIAADLAGICDEFLDFEELEPSPSPVPAVPEVEEAKAPVFTALMETIRSLEAGSDGVIWGSNLKQAMRRRLPDMDLAGLGYTTFSDLLEDAERHEIIRLERDDRSGGYYVTGLNE